MRKLVVKFGGSSLASRERIVHAAGLIAKQSMRETKIVVVVSAMGEMTDQLLSLIDHSPGTSLDKTDVDDVLAMGERMSVRVFTTALKAKGLDAKYFDPSDEYWPIITDDQFSNANPIMELCLERVRDQIIPLLDRNTIPVIAGFVGRSTDGRISTIGRGGSDTTAFILAKAIGADEVVLVTDAEGILSADPKLVANVRKLDRVDVRTLIGLADLGTKFIHRKALRYKDPKIPVRVISRWKDDLEIGGTVITGGVSDEIEVIAGSLTPSMAITVVGMSISKNPEIVANLVREIRKHCTMEGLSSDFDSVIFYVSQSSHESILNLVHEAISRFGEEFVMAVQKDLAFVKVTGVGLEETPGIIKRISQSLQESQINIHGIFTLASTIPLFIPWNQSEQAMSLIQQALKARA